MEIQQIGDIFKVDSDNCLVNDYDKIELSDKLQSICVLFVEEIRDFIKLNSKNEEDIHSAYLAGSILTGTETSYSDLNFLVLGPDAGSEEWIPYFNEYFSNIIQERFEINITTAVVLESVEFFLNDYLERFVVKCIWGEDLSLHKIDFDLITNECLDGTERSDCQYLLDRLNDTMRAVETIDIVGDYEWMVNGPKYLKSLIRCAANSVCKKQRVWSRDLFWCCCMFSGEYPEFEDTLTEILDLYLNPNKSPERIKRTLTRSISIINHISKKIEETECK